MFLKQIAAVVAGLVVAGAYPLAAWADGPVRTGVCTGAALSVFHALMGYATIEFSMKKPYGQFVQIVLGGIVARLFIMVALIVVLIAAAHVHVVSLVGSLFVTYVIFLVLEIVHVQDRWRKETHSQQSE
jgi:hypothetical protein